MRKLFSKHSVWGTRVGVTSMNSKAKAKAEAENLSRMGRRVISFPTVSVGLCSLEAGYFMAAAADEE